MSTPVLSSRERVEAATREAHIRVLLAAMNDWLREPRNPTKKRTVTRMMQKYQSGAGRLFQVSNLPTVARHGAAPLPPKEMQAAVKLIALATMGK